MNSEEEPERWDICFENHSNFERLLSREFEYRGVHIIRDPRDVMISGARYHLKAKEPWLLEPRSDLDGKSYQEFINGLPTFEDQVEFEMRHCGRWTTQEMLNWDYSNPSFYNVKYESLAVDYDLIEFKKLFEFLGFSGEQLDLALECAFKGSLFSGEVKAQNYTVNDGSPAQFRTVYDERLKARFYTLFPNAVSRLGY